ncbi:hypothetical protein Daus18300_000836 [Diaporthe australafricana]|uniref:NACHT domain-containing protein n=1 Tax=Diaporthe australafricana TaxID=127596 RepID=A0ABR3Y0I1_9PEZI
MGKLAETKLTNPTLNGFLIGLPGEHTQYLDADHRHVCKYDGPDHPNYLILKRCLLTAIGDIAISYNFRGHDDLKSQMKLISTFLGVEQRPGVDLLTVSGKQHPGTCTWLTTHPSFQAWCAEELESDLPISPKNDRDYRPRFLWLHGAPGSGKSVACGHIIQHLESCDLDCSFCFFKHGHRDKSTISSMLRSLALQMAESSFDIRKALLGVIEEDDRIISDDYQLIWNNIFLGRVFRVKTALPHFWVIDAIDECANKGLSSLLQLLAKIPTDFPLQVFISSRPSSQIQRALCQESNSVCEVQTGQQESLDDIATLIRSKRYDSAAGCDLNQTLVREILAKSNGIFLWASLILNRLEETYSEEDMHDVLHQLPAEMDDFYFRIANAVAETQSYELAKCILKWTVCASVSRPLTTNEIREAVRIDFRRTLTASDDRFAQLCGDLIFVDKESQVQVIHQTVHSFLTQHESGLRIDQASAHSRIAEVCLIYLTGKEFMPPRFRRGPIVSNKTHDMVFADYACDYFTHHLAHCSSAIDAPLILLHKFFRSNVLTWIEKTARKADLSVLTKAVRNIRSYLARRAKHRSPLGKEVQLAEAWAEDLARIVATFGTNLLDSPSSIYHLIPILSPPASNIHRLFAKDSRQLKLLGRLVEEDWDDRISCILHEASTTSVAACSQYSAVGLSNGKVMLYNGSTHELIATINHGEAVRMLDIDPVSKSLVVCGPRKMSSWSNQRTCLWTTRFTYHRSPISMTIDTEEGQVFVPGKDGKVAIYSLEDGALLDTFPLYHSPDSESDDEETKILPGTPPTCVRINPVHGLMAVFYRQSPVQLWDSNRRQKIGTFLRPGTEDAYCQPQALDMVFNPLLDVDLLAMSYDSVGIVVCDSWTLEQLSVCQVDSRTLAVSPDGRTLISGDYSGIIYLFSFESTLRTMYRISVADEMIKGIVFAPNNLRFYEIRGSFLNVWEPSVLVRRETDDESSSLPQSEEVALAAPETIFSRPIYDTKHILCIAFSVVSGSMFCGRRNGVISVYNTDNGKRIEDLQPFMTDLAIKHLQWNEKSHALLAIDAVNHCIIIRLASDRNISWHVQTVILDRQFSSPVTQVLLHVDGDFFLLATTKGDELWTTQGEVIDKIDPTDDQSQWLTHPNNPGQLLVLRGNSVQIYEWATLQRLTPEGGIPVEIPDQEYASLSGEWAFREGLDFLVKVGRLKDRQDGFVFVDVSQLQPDSERVPTRCAKQLLESNVKRVLGLHKSSLLFLDSKGWICSVSKNLSDARSYTRHFFVPPTWMVEMDLLIKIGSKSSVALVHRDDLVVFHGFLDCEEKVPLRKETGGKLKRSQTLEAY